MTPLELALEVVQRLRGAGHQALFAGGCVRDQLMGKVPKDYDVATDARPEQVQEIFKYRKTLAVGASFGVIVVVGPKTAGTIEVATFRRDGGYSDGRRPDKVEFTDAEEDAKRRDFTINGLFFDPISQETLDFVDGRRDLDERRVRAIGDPQLRLEEDRLRMLRAVRFAAILNFELDLELRRAIIQNASAIHAVSGERIGDEMRKMLGHRQRHEAARLLVECGLLKEIVEGGERESQDRANWRTRLKWLERLGDSTFETATVILLMKTLREQGVEGVELRWKLSAAERKSLAWISDHWLVLTRARSLPWSQIQPLLIHKDAPQAVQLAAVAIGETHVGVEFCQQRLGWERQQLDPQPLLEGAALQAMGLTPGPVFSQILQRVRAGQLDGELHSIEQAKKLALEIGDSIR